MKRLLDAGANGAATNESKQTPYEMVACVLSLTTLTLPADTWHKLAAVPHLSL